MRIRLGSTYIIISPFFLLVITWFIFNNKIKEFFICFLALMIHESGHIMMIYILNEKISLFKILPIGFMCKLKNQSQIKIRKMKKILIAGPIASICAAGLFLFWIKDFAMINFMIGLINLFPIGELDGMRLLNLFIEKRVYK